MVCDVIYEASIRSVLSFILVVLNSEGVNKLVNLVLGHEDIAYGVFVF